MRKRLLHLIVILSLGFSTSMQAADDASHQQKIEAASAKFSQTLKEFSLQHNVNSLKQISAVFSAAFRKFMIAQIATSNAVVSHLNYVAMQNQLVSSGSLLETCAIHRLSVEESAKDWQSATERLRGTTRGKFYGGSLNMKEASLDQMFAASAMHAMKENVNSYEAAELAVLNTMSANDTSLNELYEAALAFIPEDIRENCNALLELQATLKDLDAKEASYLSWAKLFKIEITSSLCKR